MATPTTLPASYVAGTVLTAASLNNLRGAFRILQVAQTVKTDTFTTTSSTFVDVTGLSVSITPSATSNKILVIADIKQSGGADGFNPGIRLLRDSTTVYAGDAASNRTSGFYGVNGVNSGTIWTGTAVYLDSPATTSATTYKIQIAAKTAGAAFTAGINRSNADGDFAYVWRTASSITVCEVSA